MGFVGFLVCNSDGVLSYHPTSEEAEQEVEMLRIVDPEETYTIKKLTNT